MSSPLPLRGSPSSSRISPRFFSILAILAGVVLAGFAIEAVRGGGALSAPQWPMNAVFLGLFAGWILLLSWVPGKTVTWMGSVPFALSAMLIVGVLGAIGGTIPQNPQDAPAWARAMGFHHVFSGMPFAVALLLFLTNLGLATCVKLRQLGWRGWFFSLNHCGIWIAIASGMFGAGDVIRSRMMISEGQAEAMVVDEAGRHGYLTFGLLLQRFYVEQYGSDSGRAGAPKRYAAEVTILDREKTFPQAVIEVNRPLRRDGWTLYLTNYELSSGGQPDQCLIEAVRDPWLPGVYLGIFLSLGGAVAMLFRCPFGLPVRNAANSAPDNNHAV